MAIIRFFESGRAHLAFVGCVLVLAASQKLIGFEQYQAFLGRMFESLPPLRHGAAALPVLELGIGLWLFTGRNHKNAVHVTMVLLGLFVTYLLAFAVVPGMRNVANAQGCGCGLGMPVLSLWLQMVVGVVRNGAMVCILHIGGRRLDEYRSE